MGDSSTSIVKLEIETVYVALPSCMVVAPYSTMKPHPGWSLVTEPSVSDEVLRFAVLLNEKLDL